jgi:cell division protein FtsL
VGPFGQWLRRSAGDPKETVLRRRMASLLLADVMLGLLLVWLSLMVQDIGYRIDNTSKLIEKLDLEYAELVAENAQETSPERLRRLAETELGLRVPQPGQVMTVDAQP